MATLSPIAHYFKNAGLKNLFLVHKKLSVASQKLRWRRQKLVYVNNRKFASVENIQLDSSSSAEHYGICFMLEK